jgi:hypothetical protein
MESSADGEFKGEKFLSSQAWCYAIQKENAGLMLCTPNLKNAPITTDTLKLSVVFPAHFGEIARSVIGSGPIRDGAIGESDTVECVSVEAGEVYIHIQPLVATDLPRKAAVRFRRQHAYEVLEIVNYEGEAREFGRKELSMVRNGLVLTLSPKAKWASLEDFHGHYSDALITDYFFAGLRYFLIQRADVEFDVVMSTDIPSPQTESIDGRMVARPVYESNQIDISALPFMTGPVKRNSPHFPWGDSLECWPYEDMPWAIGSRGLPGEKPYSRPVDRPKLDRKPR